MLSPERLRRDIFEMMQTPIPAGPSIREICQGSPFCSCRPIPGQRVEGGTLHTQYKKQGLRTPEARAANAAYMRDYRRKKSHGTA